MAARCARAWSAVKRADACRSKFTARSWQHTSQLRCLAKVLEDNHLMDMIARLDTRIDEASLPFVAQTELLATIPGIGERNGHPLPLPAQLWPWTSLVSAQAVPWSLVGPAVLLFGTQHFPAVTSVHAEKVRVRDLFCGGLAPGCSIMR